MIKAYIYDMDGVMIDSEPLWEKTETILLGRRNIDYDPDYRDKILGLKQEDSGKLLIDTFNLNESVEEIVMERLDILISIYEKELEMMPGLVPLLDKLRELEIPAGVASSSPLRVINFVLKMFSLEDYFSSVVSGDCTKKGKPHPEIYLQSADKLGVKPHECIAIEDSINGVKSATSAGMYCIAMPDKRLSQDKFQGAHIITDSLVHIDIHNIEKQII